MTRLGPNLLITTVERSINNGPLERVLREFPSAKKNIFHLRYSNLKKITYIKQTGFLKDKFIAPDYL